MPSKSPARRLDARGLRRPREIARQIAHPELPESAQGILVDFALGVPALGGPPRALEPGGIGRGSGLDLENGGPGPAGKLEGGDEGLGLSPDDEAEPLVREEAGEIAQPEGCREGAGVCLAGDQSRDLAFEAGLGRVAETEAEEDQGIDGRSQDRPDEPASLRPRIAARVQKEAVRDPGARLARSGDQRLELELFRCPDAVGQFGEAPAQGGEVGFEESVGPSPPPLTGTPGSIPPPARRARPAPGSG